jgi:hypothetical protein
MAKEINLCDTCETECNDQAVQILDADDEGNSKEVKLEVTTTECSNCTKEKKHATSNATK